MAIKRRDLLEASRLLSKHNLVKAGELDQAALMLGVNYLVEKREGKTTLPFPEWLDGDVTEDDDDDDENEGADLGPTESTP